MKSKAKKIVSLCIIAVLVCVLVAANVACYVLKDMIDQVLVGNAKADDATLQAQAANGESLAEQIAGEGMVLLKNDELLPLNKTNVTKVNVFGWSTTQWIGGGSGSGRVVTSMSNWKTTTGLLEALTAYGIEYNEEIINMYREFKSSRSAYTQGTLDTTESRFYTLVEPDINGSSYTQTMKENALNYSDTAIVVIGRITGESTDAPIKQYKEKASQATDNTRTYLEISTEEEALLNYVCENYDNVVVVINSVATMELGFLETIDGIDAALLTGGTGVNAATAIPKVLYGDIVPSGKLTDTYAYDLTTAASYANSCAQGTSTYTNASGLYPIGRSSNAKGNFKDVWYADYAEGIYVGYKWYETADAEGFWDSAFAMDTWGVTGYENIVQYPFGYGLSYTTFDWNIVGREPRDGATLTKDGTITVTVRVTNTGNVAGKDVVQLYSNPPYIPGGIEKASVNLVGFAKTNILEPGEHQDVEISVRVRDLASYDCYDLNSNGNYGYELDKGTYELKVMNNAHEVAMHGKNELIVEYNVASAIFYDTDDVTGNPVENKLTGDDSLDYGISIDGENTGANVKFMTREDFNGTFPLTNVNKRSIPAEVKAHNLYTKAHANDFINNDDPAVTFGASTNHKVYDNGQITELGYTLGADYDAEEWDEVLDQVTLAEAKSLVLHGYTQTKPLASIGKPKTKDADGPAQIGSFNMKDSGVGYPNATVMAQTWNSNLIYVYGQVFGKEAKALGYQGWYGPAVNIHRSPFGGRNYEYYSEDGYLSGVMGANAIKGAKNVGIYSYLKHLVVYDQETARDGLYTWLTEQSLREIYLKPFEIAVKEGGCLGMMSGYSRLGSIWSCGSYGLITGILRNEWGYEGAILSDYADHHEYMNMDEALRAGADLWMDGVGDGGSFKCETTSNTFNLQLRRATKDVLYMWLNTNYTAKNFDPTQDFQVKEAKSWWIPIVAAVDVVGVAGLAVWAVFTLKPSKKKDAE